MINFGLYNHILRRFRASYPRMYDNISDWYGISKQEVVLCFDDGKRVLFNVNSNRVTSLGVKDENPDKEKWIYDFKIKLKREIQSSGIPLAELSDLTGISRQTIINYIFGRTLPDVYRLYLIEKAIDRYMIMYTE